MRARAGSFFEFELFVHDIEYLHVSYSTVGFCKLPMLFFLSLVVDFEYKIEYEETCCLVSFGYCSLSRMTSSIAGFQFSLH